MPFLTTDQLAFVFGLLGNVISFMVFLAPVPTFCTIVRKKTSEGFQAIPYIVALFSATLLLYYAFIKTNALMIVTINGIGCVIEITYLTIYLIYAEKAARKSTLRLIVLFNVGTLGMIVVFTMLFTNGPKRIMIVGWMCASINLAVFVAPLSIMRRVIQTRSVEFMPFSLSFFLTLCAIMWFFYGFLIKDFYIALPNVLGFIFGITQMILYLVYKNASNKDIEMASKGEGDYEEHMKQNKLMDDSDLCLHVNNHIANGNAKIRKMSCDFNLESNENHV